MIDAYVSQSDLKIILERLSKVDSKTGSALLRRALQMGCLRIERNLKLNLAGKIMRVRTGFLYKSIGSRVEGAGQGMYGIIGSGVRGGGRAKYAGIHETGGVITPKRAQALTIPLQAAKTASGAARMTARELFDSFPGMVFIKRGIIFKKEGNQGPVSAMFALKKQVRIPARKYLSRTAEESGGQASDAMADVIRREL